MKTNAETKDIYVRAAAIAEMANARQVQTLGMTSMPFPLRTGGRLLAALLTCNAHVAAQTGPSTLTTIHTFAGSPDDGSNPLTIVIDSNGVLYGTTEDGGLTACSGGCGTVFSLRPPKSPGGAWPEAVYRFPGGSAGSSPQGGVLLRKNGVLDGTTLGGGSNDGTVFELEMPSSPGGTVRETVLYTFAGGSGLMPEGDLSIGSGGVLYGTTVSGGSYLGGNVFSLTPPGSEGGSWSEDVLHSFTYSGGTNPYAGVVVGKGGVLYGTTLGGGINDNGTVFALSPPESPGGAWIETQLYEFTGGSDGGAPRNGNLLLSGGVLYSTTNAGGTAGQGVVFSLTLPAMPGAAWTETVLYSFGGYSGDGTLPEAGVVFGGRGVLYGTTYTGGAYGHGTVFSLTPPATQGGAWTENVLHSFTGGSDGAGPWAPLVVGSKGKL